MAAAGRNGPLECPTRDLLLRADASNGWATTPRASGYNFWGCWGVHGPQNTPILWRCIIAGSALRAINTLNPHKEYILKLRGLSPIHSTRQHGVQVLMWGARGPFPLAAAMVVMFVGQLFFYSYVDFTYTKLF